MLSGPLNHLKHLVSPARLPFSAAYVGSLGLTLYFSAVVRIRLPHSRKLPQHITHSAAQILHWESYIRHSSDYCTYRLYRHVFSRRMANNTVDWTDGFSRRRNCPAVLIVFPYYIITSQSPSEVTIAVIFLISKLRKARCDDAASKFMRISN